VPNNDTGGLGRVPAATELLNRDDACRYLNDLGISVRNHTLAIYASRARRSGEVSKAPPHKLIANRAYYVADDVRAWAEQQFRQSRMDAGGRRRIRVPVQEAAAP
jgi:hypothetical protein